jgi:ATP-dependent RNA helicase CshB
MQVKNISPRLSNKLSQLGYQKPTHTQSSFLKVTLTKQNFIGIAPTGTGKTLTYVIPIIQKAMDNENLNVAIILPTNQLAEQIFEEVSLFADLIPNTKIVNLRRKDISHNNSQILIGTIEHMKENYKYQKFDYLVLDELDMLVDDGFEEEVLNYIYEQKINQFLAFSATHDPNTYKLINHVVGSVKLINLLKEFAIPPTIKNYLIQSESENVDLLAEVISIANPYVALVFCSSTEKCDLIYDKLSDILDKNVSMTKIHGGLNQNSRKNILNEIKLHKYQVVICSDILSRGIDIEQVSHVINYDLPYNLDYFFHRIGRTGRNGNKGVAITFQTIENQKQIARLRERKIEFIKVKLKDSQIVETNDQKRKIVKENIQSKYFVEGKKIALSKMKSKQIGKPGYKQKLKKAAQKEASRLKADYFKGGKKR